MTKEQFEKAYAISHKIHEIEWLLERLPSVKYLSNGYDMNEYISKERAEEVNDMLRKEKEIQLREELERLKKEFEEI